MRSEDQQSQSRLHIRLLLVMTRQMRYLRFLTGCIGEKNIMQEIKFEHENPPTPCKKFSIEIYT